MENDILNKILKELLNIRTDLKRLDSIEKRLDSLEKRMASFEEDLRSFKEELISVKNTVAVMENKFGEQIKALFSDVWVMNNDEHKLFKSKFKRLEKTTDNHSIEISILKSAN